MDEPVIESPPVEEDEESWQPILKRELVQTAAAVAAYLVIKVALDLADEHSPLRWRLRRWWHEAAKTISGDEMNRQIALTAARGIDYAQVWLGRQWSEHK
jgi:hypothetical protein